MTSRILKKNPSGSDLPKEEKKAAPLALVRKAKPASSSTSLLPASAVKEKIAELKAPIPEEKYQESRKQGIRDANSFMKSLNMQQAFTQYIKWQILSFSKMKEMAAGILITDSEASSPVPGSLADPRLGSYRSRECTTCNISNCGGHYGIIYFAEKLINEGKRGRPLELDSKSLLIINPIYVKTVVYLLNAICIKCSHLLANKEFILSNVSSSLEGETRIKAIGDLLSTTTICANCDKANSLTFSPKDSESQGLIHFKSASGRSIKKTIEVYNILNLIPPEHVALLNLGGVHPRDFIMRAILVTPPSARPPRFSGNSEEQDTFTKVYTSILKNLRGLAADPESRDAFEAKIIKDVGSLYRVKNDSKGHGVAASTYHRITMGKPGLLRNSIQTGRTGMTARGVLGSAPEVEFGYVTVPAKLSKELTVPEYVTVWNKQALEALANEGKIEHIIRSGRTDQAVYRGQALEYGDRVFRHLQDGDMLVFSRQPVIHRPSIMGYRAVIVPFGDNIRIHMASTTPHNADFDGDEGNIVVMVDFLAKADARYVMNVSQCVISSQDSKPIMGIVFDGLTAGFLLTSDPKPLSNELFNQITLLMTNRLALRTLVSRCMRYRVHPLSGRALFSALLPENFYYSKGDVKIVDGILVSGILSKEHIGPTENSIIQVLGKQYPAARRDQFITDANFVFNHFLAARGFTVSIEDCLPGYAEEVSKSRDPGAAIIQVLENINLPIARQLLESRESIKQAVADLKNPLLEYEAENKIAKIANDLTAKGLTVVRDKIVGPGTTMSELLDKLGSYSFVPRSEETGQPKLSDPERVKVYGLVDRLKSLFDSLRGSLRVEDDFAKETDLYEAFVKKWGELLSLDPVEYREAYVSLLREYLLSEISPFEYDRVANELDLLAGCSLDDLTDKAASDLKALDFFKGQVQVRRALLLASSLDEKTAKRIEDTYKGIKEGDLERIPSFLRDCRTLLPLFSATSNNFAVMAGKIGSGAKGDMGSIAKISASIGQQYFAGERIYRTGKCFPSVDPGDSDIRAQGYIESNFFQGLKPNEMFALMTGGRQGLMDTAVKTAKSGDLHNRINRDLENLVLDQDWRVTNDLGILISSIYGGDGFEASEMVRVSEGGHQYHFFADVSGMANKLNAEYGWVSEEVPRLDLLASEPFSISPYVERKAPPRITRFEKAAVIAERAEKLATGGTPFVEVDVSRLNDPIDLAEAEFNEGRLPLTVFREFPDGSSESIYLGYNLDKD